MLTFRFVENNNLMFPWFSMDVFAYVLISKLVSQSADVPVPLNVFLFPIRPVALRTGIRSLRRPHRRTRTRSFLRLSMILFSTLFLRTKLRGANGSTIGTTRRLVGSIVCTRAAGGIGRRRRAGQQLRDSVFIRRWSICGGGMAGFGWAISLEESVKVGRTSAGVCIPYGENSTLVAYADKQVVALTRITLVRRCPPYFLTA